MSTSSRRPDTPPGQRPAVATACGKVILLGEGLAAAVREQGKTEEVTE